MLALRDAMTTTPLPGTAVVPHALQRQDGLARDSPVCVVMEAQVQALMSVPESVLIAQIISYHMLTCINVT